tara:strand:+ start:4954 stop:5679 length:726 start_codon:yes stop_codon:yes gene_type:complete
MIKIGVFGTCRIENYDIQDLIKIKSELPYIYINDNIEINIRPLGYTTTTSDIYQNFKLIKSNNYTMINNDFLFKNIFLKRGGLSIITSLDYTYIVLEICSIKKLIHKETNFIIPYEVEGPFDPNDYIVESETFNETVENILNIQKLLNCKIILLPPITEISGHIKIGKHENTLPDKVLNYRNEIINRLESATNNNNIFFINWNKFIKEEGEKKMLEDQFHFTIYGQQYISNKIINFIIKQK